LLILFLFSAITLLRATVLLRAGACVLRRATRLPRTFGSFSEIKYHCSATEATAVT